MTRPETDDSARSSILESIQRVILDGIDYFQSALSLLQARMAGTVLSVVLFALFVIVCGVLAFAAFTLITIAIGIWLAQVTGSAAWSLVILGGFYGLIAIFAGQKAVQWMRKLNS